MQTKSSPSETRVIDHLRDIVNAADKGQRLPSVRQLMSELRVSPATVQQAVALLSREGLLEARPGQGTFVAGRPAHARPSGEVSWQSLALGPGRGLSTEALDDFGTLPRQTDLVLNAGYPPEDLQPLPLLEKATIRAARSKDVWARMPIEGDADLRAWFSEETRSIFQPHEIIICPGTQAALSAAFRALAAPGDTILMESPTYAGAIAAAKAVGLKIVPVPTDEQGVRTSLLDDAFRMTGARLFYCQPCYANPTGAVLSEERRLEVIDIIERHGAFLIEDDWARDFQLDSAPMPEPLAREDRNGHVIYVRSLTKCSAPGLRVGAICARGAGYVRLRQARLVDDFFVPGILQLTTLELVRASGWTTHLKAMRAKLRERRDALVHELRQQLGIQSLTYVPSGGLHLWVKLPAGVSDREVHMRAAYQGILVSPGYHWFPGEPPEGFLRLSFAAAKQEQIGTGIASIASIIGELSL